MHLEQQLVEHAVITHQSVSSGSENVLPENSAKSQLKQHVITLKLTATFFPTAQAKFCK